MCNKLLRQRKIGSVLLLGLKTWRRIAPAGGYLPPPLSKASMCNVELCLYLFGGETEQTENANMGRGYSNKIYRYSIVEHKWEEISPKSTVRPPAVCGCTIVAVGRKLCLIGGIARDNSINDQVYVFDTGSICIVFFFLLMLLILQSLIEFKKRRRGICGARKLPALVVLFIRLLLSQATISWFTVAKIRKNGNRQISSYSTLVSWWICLIACRSLDQFLDLEKRQWFESKCDEVRAFTAIAGERFGHAAGILRDHHNCSSLVVCGGVRDQDFASGIVQTILRDLNMLELTVILEFLIPYHSVSRDSKQAESKPSDCAANNDCIDL
ncbi:Kelch repeat-containing protein 2 [Trichinella sp. T8]|nr:Kelch repeat-containing protein 2 [Trichinella sp. T8]